MDDLDQIAFVEQAQLNRPVLDELANLDGLECADPTQSLDVLELIDLLLADHPPVPNHDKVLQTERALDFLHFRHERRRIRCVARVNGHGDGTAVVVGEQTVVDLELPLLAVTAVA